MNGTSDGWKGGEYDERPLTPAEIVAGIAAENAARQGGGGNRAAQNGQKETPAITTPLDQSGVERVLRNMK
jgi:hypothetical protein